MNVYEKIKQIAVTENISLDIRQGMSWLSVENILQHRRCEKYSVWLTTGKILPEAGQISPALAHNGQWRITSLYSMPVAG